ncbi:MAG: 30S ribosomal protein S20 [Deltaproteobacteria bacterium CG11_big_fil_rev_8_21_14_0_20_49_13]|nr:MAG: 30S ribosomal protein S20 [Deltaproteobacteria bacterium CG11_big_fil_rev_8_21_14_0_20_49_13]
MADARKQKKLKCGRHLSSLKRARQDIKRTARNTGNLSTMRTAIKKVKKAIVAKNKEAATTALTAAIPVIAKSANKNATNMRTASRYISRLTVAVNRL